MTRTLVLRRIAKLDIIQAHDWYNRQRPGLGEEFEESIAKLFETIVEWPFAFSPVGKGVRKIGDKRFPYHVFYQVTSNTVVVFAIMHAARDPNDWKSRIR